MLRGWLTLVVCAGCAFGQTTATAAGPKPLVLSLGDPAQFGSVGIMTALAGPMGIVAGAPYSAQVTTERVQTLADGNRIEQTSSGSVARDSQGRVRRDEALPGLTSADGDAHFVMIDDPVAQVHWTLDAQTKTAIKMPAPAGKGAFGALTPPPPSGKTKMFFFSPTAPLPLSAGAIQISSPAAASKDENVSETDLGAQTVEGVPAQGKRMTRTIPAGQIGNEQPIVITTETWYSPDLKVLVMSKSNDPRMGETTYTLSNIQRTEPAASLFQVPDDYTIRDNPGSNSVYQDTKKNQ